MATATNPLITRLDFYAEMVRANIFRASALAVAFVLLYRHMNGSTGRCDPARAMLASETGLSRASVIRAIAELEQSGWWSVGRNEGTAGPGGRPNTYRPNFERGVRDETPSHPKGVSEMRPLCAEGGLTDEPKGVSRVRPEPGKNQEEDSHIGGEGLSRFEEAKRLYPSRAPHPNPEEPARRAFAAALRRGADPDAITRGIANYARYVDEHISDRQRVAMMANWLNESRWNDHQEIAPQPPRRFGTGLF